MYRVVTMYGTDEPWWFFEGWKEDIVSVDEFDDFFFGKRETAAKYS